MNMNQMDPLSNNQPLSFNNGKVQQYHPDMDGQGTMINRDEMPSSTQPGMAVQMMSSAIMQDQSYMQGMSYPAQMMGTGDPSMMMMGQMGYNQYGSYMTQMGSMGPPAAKEIITLKSCVLYPPSPTPVPSIRDRPPGCRTIFVGGLPENITDEIVHEVFESCGNICTIRLSKKKFCHIRFEFEDSVERAMYISGKLRRPVKLSFTSRVWITTPERILIPFCYSKHAGFRMKLEDKDDNPNTGKIHVDYAQARDDQYEFECKERLMAREMRHIQRLNEEMMKPPSPPPVLQFTEYSAVELGEKLKCDDDFMQASLVLIAWLDRGDCTHRTVNSFYGLIQSTNSHVRRLLTEKQGYEEELQSMQMQFRQRVEGILRQFGHIEKVFAAALKKKAWDHFSKAQRKNIDLWYKQAKETHKFERDQLLSDRKEAEMEMSDPDDDEVPVKKLKEAAFAYASNDEMNTLQMHNNSLKCQVDAYNNEMEIIKHEGKKDAVEKEKQIKALQNALQGMQQQLIAATNQAKESSKQADIANKKIAELSIAKFRASQEKEQSAKDAPRRESEDEGKTEEDENTTKTPSVAIAMTDSPNKPVLEGISPTLLFPTESAVSSSGLTISEKESRLLGLISCFLHVHPLGATTDYIWSYLHRLDIPVRSREVEDLLERIPSVFEQTYHGVGATIERRWKFMAFKDT